MNMENTETQPRRTISDKRKGKGVTLRGTLWERLDQMATDQDVTVSRVIEGLLEGALSRVQDSTKMAETPAIRGIAIFRPRVEGEHEE